MNLKEVSTTLLHISGLDYVHNRKEKEKREGVYLDILCSNIRRKNSPLKYMELATQKSLLRLVASTKKPALWQRTLKLSPNQSSSSIPPIPPHNIPNPDNSVEYQTLEVIKLLNKFPYELAKMVNK